MKIVYKLTWYDYVQEKHCEETVVCEGATEKDCIEQIEDVGYARADKGPFKYKAVRGSL